MIDKKQLQELLEKDACKKNRGICETYNYCKFCKEPTKVFRISNTPCADAFLDSKDINNMLKRYMVNKAKIATINERLGEWYKALETGQNILDVPEDNFGMPKPKNVISSPIEKELEYKELNYNKIKEMIKAEEERLKSLEQEVRKMDIAFSVLNDKEMFLIECRYFENMNWFDIENTYNKKYNTSSTEKTLQNKIAGIKLKLLEIIKTGKKVGI